MTYTVSISFSILFLTASIPRLEKISQMSLLIVLCGSTSLSARTLTKDLDTGKSKQRSKQYLHQSCSVRLQQPLRDTFELSAL